MQDPNKNDRFGSQVFTFAILDLSVSHGRNRKHWVVIEGWVKALSFLMRLTLILQKIISR
jgi:hypothetical protein